MEQEWQRRLEDVAETLIQQRRAESGRSCSLLLGAGCSQTAGIPLASGFVKAIKSNFSNSYHRADPKDYAHCMAQLPPGQRRDLIRSFVSKAKPNVAHYAVSLLIQAGFVDRILTTNFDSLVLQACARLEIFPGIYDLALSKLFKAEDVFGPAILHLHGQHTGFVLLNTAEEMEANKATLAPAFKDAGKGRTWIVVGYSGENDPVFELLTDVDVFDHSLYWIGYRDNSPPDHVLNRLLRSKKFAFYVKGFDADKFFAELAIALGVANSSLLGAQAWRPGQED